MQVPRSEDLRQGRRKCVALCRFAYARDGDTNRRVGRALCRWHEAALRPSSPIPVTIACPDPRRPPSSAPRDLTVSCVAVGREFALPLCPGKCHRPLPRVARIDRAPRGSREPAPSPVLDSGLSALTAIVEFILRYCSTVFQPQRRQTARPRPERAEKASAAKRRKPALPHSAVGFSGAWWKTVVFGV